MKTVIIYGVEHKGCNYNAVQVLKEHLGLSENELIEFYLPKDLPHFCCGCNNCFYKGEENCPHQSYVTPIKEAMYEAELLIFACPVYVFHVSGQLKAFLDHFGFQFMAHRPNKQMYSKTAFVISLGAGGGMDTVIKDITDSLKWWGISRIFTYGCAINAANWESVSDKKKEKINRKLKSIAKKIKNKIYKPKTSIKVKMLFTICRLIQIKFASIPYDFEYWKKQGWLEKKRPWKNK